MKRKNIVVITDCKDIAYTEMKYIVKDNVNSEVEFDLVEVEEFSLINAAFESRLIIDILPKNTLIWFIINPTTQRHPRIYGKLKNGVEFFGANTSAMTWMLEDIGIEKIYEINDPGFITFGGKNVHTINVANMINGIPYHDFGMPFPAEKLNPINIPTGTVVHIDNFGLIKIKGERLNLKNNQKVKIFKNNKFLLEAKYADRMMNNKDKEWILYNGSSLDFPELGTVRYKNGYKDMDIKIGDIITWEIIQ